MVNGYTPERGDIILLDFSPHAGSEMAGPHPAIVLSDRKFNVGIGRLVACPITSKVKGSPFEVRLPPGLKTVGCVIASDFKTMDYLARNARFKERAPLQLLQNVQAIVCAVLGCA